MRHCASAFRFLLLTLFMAALLGPSFGNAAPTDLSRRSKMEWIVQERIDKLERTLGSRVEKRLSPDELAEYKDSSLRVDTSGRLFLSFHADQQVGDWEKAGLRDLGAGLDMSTADIPPFRGRSLVPPNYGAIDAWVPYDRVEAAASLPWVTTVSAVEMAHSDVGSVTSEGVELHRADLAQAAGIDGSGVTVGVVSTGAVHFEDSIDSGDLPADLTLLGPDLGSKDEGTAMMEIVHDMAPGARLLFYPTNVSVNRYVAALRGLAASGSNVIAEDIPFDTEPAFQQGLAAHAAQVLAETGISIYGSVGNLGNWHAKRMRAKGTGAGPSGNKQFNHCPKPPTNVVSTFDIEMSTGAPIDITLQWSEPPNHAFTNLDLYLMGADGVSCLKTSLAAQGGGTGRPLEFLEYTNTGSDKLAAKIVVNLADNSTAAGAPLIDLRWRTDDDHDIFPISSPERAGSLNPNVNFTGAAMSVGAANAHASTDPAQIQLESFSSAGPIILENTTVCPQNRYPCEKGTEGRMYFKGNAPDWTAADRVVVSSASHFSGAFEGTSAAAPHAAGCDALIRGQLKKKGIHPTAALVRSLMEKMAVSRGDRADWGAGVLSCYPIPH